MAGYIKREAEYIERDMLCRVLERYKKAPKNRYQRGVEDGMELALNAVKAIHTADVAPVVRGRWEHLGGDEWCCSACGFVITTEGSWDKPTKKYCEDCGAKMDGERKDGGDG